jgi:hypothetical protein
VKQNTVLRLLSTLTMAFFFAWNHPQQATVAHDGSTFDADEGNDAQLVVFEALPLAFWYRFQLPETKEALEIMARFFDDKLGC